MTCCGLFCLSALPAEIGELNTGIAIGPAHLATPDTNLPSQTPELLVRPPISLLFG